jgi:hypothetical protein
MGRDDLLYSYTCEPLKEGLIVGKNKLISRKGEQVFTGTFDEVEFLDNGLIIITNRGRKGVITTWGTNVLPQDYLDIRPVDSLFLLAKRGGKYSIFSTGGLQLTEPLFDDVQISGKNLILFNDNRIALYPISSLYKAVLNRAPMEFSFVDDMEILNDGSIWVQVGDKEALLDASLKPLIPMELQQIEILEEGFLCIRPTTVKLFSTDILQKFTTEEKLLDFNERYARFTAPESEALFDLPSFRFVAFPDSVMLVGSRYAITETASGSKIYPDAAQSIDLPEFKRWRIMNQGNEEKLMVAASGKEYIVETNLLLELPRNTNVSLLNDSLFVVEQNGKKGIWNTLKEEFIVPLRYETLANFDGRDISLFQNKKFGLYRVTDNTLIPPISEKLVTAFGDSLFMIVQNGKKGLINGKQETYVPPEFDEIAPWSDSLALVKNGQDWHVFNMSTQVHSSDAIRDPRFINCVDERFMIVFLDQKFGVFSNKRGEIIPATFDDIINIGTTEDPLFFTETYVDAAQLHVVIYFDKQGKLLLRQAVEPEFFEEIYCYN